MLKDTLRQATRDMIGRLSHLDSLVAEAEELPDRQAAAALVEVDRLGERVAKLIAKLGVAGGNGQPQAGRNRS
jgi:hypothetical protein